MHVFFNILEIYVHIWRYTVYARICMYMHVYRHICMYVAPSGCTIWLWHRICTYMHVFDSIYMYMPYMHVYSIIIMQICWKGFHTAARKRRQIPLQNTSRQRFGRVLPSMNMYVYARICTYINVYVCICMYMYVYDVYACILDVYACISSYDPLNWCHLPKTHSLWTAASWPHSGHPKASGHAFFSVVGDTFADPILRTPPLSTRPVPL